MKILFVHQLNNYTGSPRVLENIIKSISREPEIEIHLLSSNSKGALSEIENVTYHNNLYKIGTNKIQLFFSYIISQLYQFFFVLLGKKYDCIYINTITPFCAAFAAKIRGERIIYHVHEYYLKSGILYSICEFFLNLCSNSIIFVSDYLLNCYDKENLRKSVVIHNSVSKEFEKKARMITINEELLKRRFESKTIMMACSLKAYKGIYEFIKIAAELPDYCFSLVVSDSMEKVNSFFAGKIIPQNINILCNIDDMHSLYNKSSLVINLTLPRMVIESFGMTLIEAFEYGIPCIAPNYGGPKEIIEDGKNGYLVNPCEIDVVVKKIKMIFKDFTEYNDFSRYALESSKKFSPEMFINKIKQNILNN